MRGSTTTVLLAVALVLPMAVPAVAQPSVRRIAGPTRVETAVSLSVDAFGTDEASAVVLARAGDFPDALAGGVLAVVRRGPLLLTPSEGLAPVTRAEIDRVLPDGGDVLLLGGDVALAPAVQDALDQAGYRTTRLAGASRYETSLAIARAAAPEPAFITLATGNDFPDALIAGSLAASFQGGVLVLSDGESLTEGVRSYLEANGGAAATTVGPAAAAAWPSAFNVGGADPAARSVRAAQTFFDSLSPDNVAVASVQAFPDGLAGAPHAFLVGGLAPLLLTPAAGLPDGHVDYLTSLDASGTSYVYGGNAAVNERVIDQMTAALGT